MIWFSSFFLVLFSYNIEPTSVPSRTSIVATLQDNFTSGANSPNLWPVSSIIRIGKCIFPLWIAIVYPIIWVTVDDPFNQIDTTVSFVPCALTSSIFFNKWNAVKNILILFLNAAQGEDLILFWNCSLLEFYHFELLSCKNQTLLMWENAFFVLDLGLYILNSVRHLDFERYGLAS